jgi:hypothetical protein
MKKLLLLFAFSATLCLLNAQTRDSEFFKKVQKVISKAEGKKYVNLMGYDKKVGEQVFTYDVVSVISKGLGKYDSNWVTEYSKIDWSSLSYSLSGVYGNDDLTEFYIRLKSNCKEMFYAEDKKENDGFYVSNEIKIYVLSKHVDELKAIFDAQYK